jgi:hypothetical protein
MCWGYLPQPIWQAVILSQGQSSCFVLLLHRSCCTVQPAQHAVECHCCGIATVGEHSPIFNNRPMHIRRYQPDNCIKAVLASVGQKVREVGHGLPVAFKKGWLW